MSKVRKYRYSKKPEIVPFSGLNSLLAETLSAIAHDFDSIGEVDEFILENNSEYADLLNLIKEEDISDPLIYIQRFVNQDASNNFNSLERLMKNLNNGKVAVFLPLPPHIIRRINHLLPQNRVLSTIMDLPPHMNHLQYEEIQLENILEIRRKLNDRSAILVEGNIEDRSIFIHPNAFSAIEHLLNRDTLNIFVHQPPHVVNKKSLTQVDLLNSQILIERIE